MRIMRAFVLTGVFFAALLAGFRASAQTDWFEGLFRLSLTNSASPARAEAHENQYNWLIIRVDDREAPHPKLESVWLAIHNEATRKVMFVAVFPAPDDEPQNRRLAAAFSLEGGKPGQDFLTALQAAHHIWWDGYFLVSRQDSVRVIDALGGIPMGGARVDGQQAVAQIPSWEDDPQQAVAQQRALLQGFCAQLEQVRTPQGAHTAWKLMLAAPADKRLPAFLQVTHLAVQFHNHERFSCEFPE